MRAYAHALQLHPQVPAQGQNVGGRAQWQHLGTRHTRASLASMRSANTWSYGRSRAYLPIDAPDQLIWKWSASGTFSAQSCFAATFQGSTSCYSWKLVWESPTNGHSEEDHGFHICIFFRQIKPPVLVRELQVSCGCDNALELEPLIGQIP